MTLQTINTQSASLTANLTAGSRYVWRVGVPRGDGNLTFSDWSDPFTAVQPADNSIQVGSDIDIGTGKILYSNVYPTLADLPAAASYHGMFAHVHDEGAAYYAHGGNWVRLADDADVPTAFVSGLNGLTGPVILAAGNNVQIGQSGNQLTISSTQAFTTLNGESGSLSLVGGGGIAVSTVDGTITVSGAGLATEGFVNQAVADLVNSAPQTLDTLAELANALNNDSDFAANVTTLISQKADASHSHEIANVTGLQSALDAKANANHEHVKANITDLTTGDLDMQGNRVLFANYYATQGDFPDPAVYHGMVAHSHADGAAYYAHAGAWVRLANQSDIPASTAVNGLTGSVGIVAGDHINVTTTGQNVVVSADGIVWSTPPQNGSSPGSPGDIAYDDNFLYLRTSQAWRQVALSPISTNITISQQPSNQSVDDGDTATFTVLATAGGETITYQWGQSADNGSTFVDVAGATANTLTLNATLNDDGTQYRVLLSAAGASDVTSDVATLTVSETFRVLAESGDNLLTESGDFILHDGVAAAVTISLSGPTNQTAINGNATFSVSATSNDGSVLTYQWEARTLTGGGETWTQRTLPASANWRSVTYGNGTFVAVAQTSNIAATSTDGITWTQRTLSATADWRSVTYGNGTFVAVAYGDNIAATSTDGITWTHRTVIGQPSAIVYWYSVTYGNGVFVAVAYGNFAATSTDGITWTQRTLPAIAYWYSVTYGNGVFVAVGNIAATSTDGITWTQRTLPASGNWQSVTYGGGVFVALLSGLGINSQASNIAATSTDGITWTQRTLPASANWLSVTYGDGVFVAVAEAEIGSNVSNIAATSTDGITWTQRTLPASANWRSVTYGDGVFVAVAETSNIAATGTGTLQWLEITGETTNKLTVTGLTADDNGDQYRVIVDSPSVEPVTSNVATLAVPSLSLSGPTNQTAAIASDWSQLGADIDGEAAGDNSGWSVALSSDGSRVAIGAYGNDGNGSNSGHVRVYDWSGTAWVQVGADIDGEAAYDQSGYSVALSSDGSRVAIGANGNDGGGVSSGHVRIYDWSGSAWVQVGADIDGEAGGSPGDQSGYSIALSSDGSRVAIGAIYNGGNGTDSGHVRIYDWSGSAWVQVGADIDGEAAGDQSGISVALSSDGSRVAIGAYRNDGNGNGTDSGHVRIYDWSGSAWVQVGADIDGEAAGDYSGRSVALSSDGSRVAIGAIYNDGNGSQSGHVRIYDWSGSAWVQAGADIDGEAAYDQSGWSVALSSDGSRVAIGANANDGNSLESGHVRIYDWSGSAWVQVGADIDGEASSDMSGYSVALSSDGSRVAIGAYLNDGNGSQSGHVRVFDLAGTTAATFSVSATASDGSALTYQWQKSDDGVTFANVSGATSATLTLTGLTAADDNGDQYRVIVDSPSVEPVTSNVATLAVPSLSLSGPTNQTAAIASDWSQLGLDIDGEAAEDYSGYSVALSSDGSRVAIGAYGNDGGGDRSGHVRIYDWSGSAWVQVGADIDGEAAEDQSGISVALSSDGSRVAIGANGNDGGGVSSGHVRIYDWSGVAWVQVGADIDGEAAEDQSGFSVALSSDGSRVAIGAYINGGGGTESGHVRIFDWSGSAWVQVGADIDGEAAYDQSGFSVALSSDGSRVAIGAYGNDGGGDRSGHVRIYDWSGSAWVQVGADIDGEAAEDYSGRSVALSSDGSRVAIGAYLNDGGGVSAGHVRIFDWSGSAWVQVGADIDGEAAYDYSGHSVALSSDGSRVVIGAYGNDGNGAASGHVRIYDWSGSAWVQVGADIDGEAAYDNSGWSVALSGDGSRVAIGAYSNDGNGAQSGHVRIFDLASTPSATFSVSASASDGSALTYQWQKSDDGITFANVSGATSATLSLTGLTAADDNGDQYRVIVDSPSVEPVTSTVATLTVT